MSTVERTPLQIEADQLDCRLYTLIRQMEAFADRLPDVTAKRKLHATAHKLRLVRPDLRELMHPTDREVTS